MPNHWIEHVNKYAKENGMNYNQALKKRHQLTKIVKK